MAAYQEALDGPQLVIGAKRTKPGTVSAAIAGYYTSLEFRALAAGTQKMRRAILERFRAAHGDKPIALLPTKFIAHVLSTMKPFAARNWIKTIRHLMQYCIAHEMCAADPTQGIKLPRAKTDGHHTWTDDEISQYEAAHPIGGNARLARALGVYTGLRRGDAVKIGPQHLRRCAHRAAREDRWHHSYPGAHRLARHPRRHPERQHGFPGDGVRQAFHGRRFRCVVSQALQ